MALVVVLITTPLARASAHKYAETGTTLAPTTTTTLAPTTTTTVHKAPMTTTTLRPRPTTPTTIPKEPTKPALPYVGTDYGYATPPGDPGVVSDGFINCNFPHPIAYIKFSTGYSELITVDMSGVNWTFPMDFEGAVLLNPLVVSDIPGEISQGITHTAGADGCVIWPDASQPGYIGGPQPIDPNSPG